MQHAAPSQLQLRRFRRERQCLACRGRYHFDVLRTLERIPQHTLQLAVFNDEGKLAQAGVISAEIKLRSIVVANNAHCLDLAYTRHIKFTPHAAALEKRRAAGALSLIHISEPTRLGM